MHIHPENHWNDNIFYWYQSHHWYQWTIGIAWYLARPHEKIISPVEPLEWHHFLLVPMDHRNRENNRSPLNEMHIHQQNHWNDILFYWYQSYHWYQWTIGIDESYPFVCIGHDWTDSANTFGMLRRMTRMHLSQSLAILICLTTPKNTWLSAAFPYI